jgi:acyl carrier protein
MTKDEVAAAVAALASQITGLDASRIVLAANLADDLELDSLAMAEIAAAAEDRFGVKIPDSMIETFKTVEDLVDYIHLRLG